MEEETVGELLRRLLTQKDLSQRKLAILSGVDRGYINALVKGKGGSISLRIARQLAEALGESPEIFLKSDIRPIFPWQKEKPEDLLERLRLAHPVSIPVYTEFPVYAGEVIEPREYIYRARPGTTKRNVEGYIARGNCLTPIIGDGDIIIVDREATIENGDIVACLIGDSFLLGKLKQVGDQLWLENNNGTTRYEHAYISAVVIEVIRRLK